MHFDERLIVLACNHAYHETCLTKWLPHNSACPLCRSPVICIQM